MSRTPILCTCIASAALLAAAALLTAGPLNPPAGPVNGTYKTLTEVEPRTAINAANTPGDATSLFRINQPGSYYLTGNITGVVGKNGIVIGSSGVTLDLNGFDLVGIAGMGSFCGVRYSVNGLSNIAVLHGSVRSWGDRGLDLQLSSNCYVEGVVATGNLGTGIGVGSASTISNCSANGNGTGLFMGPGSTANGCATSGNSSYGIYASDHCTLTNCTANSNTSTIFQALAVGSDCVVSNCTANLNTSTGIVTGDNCIVEGCTVVSNGGNGITVIGGCTVRGCVVTGNPLNGIQSSTGGYIHENLCNSNGLAAGTQSNILLTGDSARVEGNSIIGGDRGIATNGAGNVIVRNSVRGGTNAYGGIAAGNDVGPIGSAATAASPWANISY